jgi:hypothetical protein
VRWHRQWLRRLSTRRSRSRPEGRPPIDPQNPRARPPDGDGESIVGSTEDSRRVAHPRCQRLRTHGVASATTAPTSAFANMEHVPHQSHRVSCVDGFLHGSDDHRPAPVRPRLVVAAPPADRMSTSPITRRRRGPRNRLSTRFPTTRRPVGCTEIATRSTVTSSGDDWQAWALQRVSGPARPWQNPYVERLIGSIRRECLNHVIVINEAHLRRLLTAYRRYYHGSRTHLGLQKDTPDHRPVSEVSTGPIVAIPEVGGLRHRYARCAA